MILFFPPHYCADHRFQFQKSRQLFIGSTTKRLDALIFVAAVNNIHAVAGDRVMKSGARVLGDEPEESFPPRIIGVTKHLSAKFL